jgi:ribosomal protein L16 Arg81 hydroxylase
LSGGLWPVSTARLIKIKKPAEFTGRFKCNWRTRVCKGFLLYLPAKELHPGIWQTNCFTRPAGVKKSIYHGTFGI